ncbi:MAG: MmgE/PrpD family protein, partial [Chloroflexota bacterium]
MPTILHPTGPIMSAALPLAEWKGRSGKDLLLAHGVALEVSARASLALYPEHYDVGWHMTGTTGTLGAATASALLLGLDEGQLLHALGIAATQAAGQREQFGAMTKSLHCGKAASNGALAALLALGGWTAAADSLQGRRGMFNVMSTASKPAELVDGLGERWEIRRNGFKPYACGVVTHPAIDAVRRLGSEQGVRAEDVDRIELRVHPLVLELTGKTDPQTGLEGKFSIGFATAIALIDGAARPRQFTDANVRRADVVALRNRIHAVADAGLSHTEAVATAYLIDGAARTEHVRAASGTPENPMSDADVRDKFMDLAGPALGQARAAALASMVSRLETLD